MHTHLRKSVTEWLHERLSWPNPENTTGLLLNQKGARLGTRGAHEIITRIETTRSYSLPTTADREHAINSLPTDR